MNVAEDIQIGADTSQAVANIGAIGKAFEEAARAAGVADKTMNAALRQQERATGTLMAAVARKSAASVTGLRSEMAAVKALTAAQQERAKAEASAATGLRTNSSGRVIAADSGKFVGAADAKRYEANLALRQDALKTEAGLEERLAVIRDNNARRAEANSRMQTSAYQNQQKALDKVFGATVYATDSTRWQKLGRFMQTIPPASWANRFTDAASRISNMSNSTRYAMYDVSNSFGIAGAAILGFGVLATRAAITHERAFANVRRTTQTTAAGYEVLRKQLEGMAMSMPVTYDEITKIASSAGQLGISATGVSAFTQTVAKLSATTNLTSDAAATALARFRAFFAESSNGDQRLAVTEQTFSNLASSILKVGVNSIATETGIVNVATQIASMGQYSGMTANQVIGLAGALSSIGVAPELARGTITRTFSNIGTAVSKGGEDLNKFAALAGMTSQQFKASWGTDTFAATFAAMMKGLYNVTQSGEDANLMLMEMGFNSVRDRPLLLRLAGAANEMGEAGGLMSQTLEDAYSGWVQNSELALQYSKISTTTAARIQVLGQAFEQLFATMGAQSGGLVGELASGMTDFIRGLEALASSPAGQVLSTIGIQAAVAVGGMLLLIAAAARMVASIQGVGVAFGAMQRAGVTSLRGLSMGFKIANLSLGIIGIVGALAAAVVGFVAFNDAQRDAQRGVQDMNGLVSAMSEDARSGAGGLLIYSGAVGDVGKESDSAKEQARNMTDALYGTEAGASAGADGLDKMSESAKNASYVFGESARAFYKAQLQQSDSFQDLFDPSKRYDDFLGSGLTIKDLGLDPSKFDFNEFIEESLSGGLDTDQIKKKLSKELNIDKWMTDSTGANTSISKEYKALSAYVDDLGGVFADMDPKIKAAIASQNAFGAAGTKTAREINAQYVDAATAMEQMDEATQKAVESAATGFTKFADAGNLIKLTQQMGIAGKDAAAEYEKAWQDAYGGASFKLSDYLTNFRRAAGEQSKFVENLQNLSLRGLSASVIGELSAMGPEANKLVQALVDGTDAQLQEYEALWGQTGYDAMVQFAVQSRMAQDIVNQVFALGGTNALKSFNDKLATGVGVDVALLQVQQEMNKTPLKPKANTPKVPNMSWAAKKLWEEQNRLNLVAGVRLRVINPGVLKWSNGVVTAPGSGFAEGGWTGSGSKMTPKGTVHADEFVFTKKAVNNVGVGNLYAMMRQAESGRSAPRGRGYANGGLVGGGSSMLMGGPNIVYLSPEDRALIRSLQPHLRIGNRDIAQAQSEANFVNKRQGVG